MWYTSLILMKYYYLIMTLNPNTQTPKERPIEPLVSVQERVPISKDSGKTPEHRTTAEGELVPEGAVSIESVKNTLDKEGYDLVGERGMLSGSILGPLYKLQVRSRETGEEGFFTEKVFSKNGTRFVQEGVLDDEGGIKYITVDYLFNKQKAVKALRGLPGIPEAFAVYDGEKGSSLEAYVAGCEVSSILSEDGDRRGDFQYEITSEQEINEIYKNIEYTYVEAAKRGFILTIWPKSLSGIMVETNTLQPYFNDLHLYVEGDIEHEGPVLDKFKKGLKSIKEHKQGALEQFNQLHIERIRQAM